jgi:uncharacterized sporulation protein YeaH/YhbH (DUF444 family)
MTAEQYRIENYNYKISDGDNIENLMQEFAKIKCKELLEIVVEKAKAEIKYEYSGNTGSEYLDEWAVVDKDSILNAVDLEKFCS